MNKIFCRLKLIAKKNEILYKTLVYWYSLIYENLILDICNEIRIFCGIHSKIDGIAKFKGVHKGERCFIVATGPSLTVQDIELIKNEITFSMNSIVKIFSQTDWRPTYYGIQDKVAYKNVQDQMSLLENNNGTKVFYSSRIKNVGISNGTPYYLTYMAHGTKKRGRHKYKFSWDCFKRVYDGFSISYSMLQLAVYMGFKKIFIIGLDADYPLQGKIHFDEESINDNTSRGTKQSQVEAFEYCKNQLLKHGIEVYNVTRGGKLETFPRMKLEDALKCK